MGGKNEIHFHKSQCNLFKLEKMANKTSYYITADEKICILSPWIIHNSWQISLIKYNILNKAFIAKHKKESRVSDVFMAT